MTALVIAFRSKPTPQQMRTFIKCFTPFQWYAFVRFFGESSLWRET